MKTIQFTDLSLKNVNMRCDNNVTIGGFIIGKELFVILMFIRQEIAKRVQNKYNSNWIMISSWRQNDLEEMRRKFDPRLISK